MQLVLQTGSKHLLMHFGQSIFSQPLSGHLISQTGGSHYTLQLANLGLLHLGSHFGGSQIGSQTAFYLFYIYLGNEVNHISINIMGDTIINFNTFGYKGVGVGF